MFRTIFKAVAFFLLFLILLPFAGRAQEKPAGNSTIPTFLKPGKIQSLSSCFDEIVTLETPSEQATFRKQQAIQHFNEFIRLYPADSIRIHKQGLSGGDNQYLIGDYYSGNNTFYIYIVSRKQRGEDLIFNLNLNKK